MQSTVRETASGEARALLPWEYAVLCLGFGFLFAVIPFGALSTAVMRQASLAWQEILLARTVFLIAVAGFSYLVGPERTGARSSRSTGARLGRVAVGGFATIAGTAVYFVGQGVVPPWLVGLAGGLVTGFSFALVLGEWLGLFYAVRRTRGRRMCMVAFALSFLTTVLITWLSNWANLAGLGLLAVVTACVCCSCALFALLVWGSGDPQGAKAGAPGVEFDLTTYTRAILLAFGLSWSLAYNMSIDVGYGSTGSDETVRWLATIVSCGALLVFMVVFMRTVDIDGRRFGLLLRWVIAAVGILWAFAPAIIMAIPVLAGISFIMVFWVQLVVLFIFVMEVCLESGLPFSTVLSSYFGTFVLGACVGSALFLLVKTVVGQTWMAYSLLAAAGAAASLLVMPFMPNRASNANVFTLERFPEDEDAAERNERARRAFVEGCGFTPREVEVLDLLILGRTRNEIATELDISPWTVKNHIRAVFAKTDTHSAKELMALVYGERE